MRIIKKRIQFFLTQDRFVLYSTNFVKQVGFKKKLVKDINEFFCKQNFFFIRFHYIGTGHYKA